MIVYSKTKAQFSDDVFSNAIEEIVSSQILKKANHRVSPQEMRAFHNSLAHMDRVLNDSAIPDDSGISIEYHIPQTAKRVDFIISGLDGTKENVIIIELKQWQECEATDSDGMVRAFVGGRVRPVVHPSYQAYSYAALLRGFNATVEEEEIRIIPCAYLHNYVEDDQITDESYRFYLDQAPVFLKHQAGHLREFIKEHVKEGDTTSIMSRIDNGKIRPTKSLADVMNSLMQGNKEFVLIDDQKVAYETIRKIALRSDERDQNVIIIEGGAGTGKTVIAINILVDLLRQGHLAQYVTKTSAPRDVYFEKLKGGRRLAELKSLFVGSGSFMRTPRESIKALFVDEAHRLTEKTGFYKQGDNQVREIIDATHCAVFFIDEGQKVHVDDYGGIEVIEEIAESRGRKVHHLQLASQFRCNGSDGYIAWLDHMLQIRQTANLVFNREDYDFDFRVMDSALELQQLIYEKNKVNNKARMVAGYCWPWKSKKNPDAFDFNKAEFGFDMKWNMTDYGGKWIIDPRSVTEIGCIHTAQGLETDYIGVIVGDDLIVRDGQVLVQPYKRAPDDRTIWGWRKGEAENPDYWRPLLRSIVKNTYKTLMTRGMKGCYVYFTDPETAAYFKGAIAH